MADHLNQPEILYSDGKAALGSEPISRTVALDGSYLLASGMRSISSGLVQTSFGYGLHAKANLLSSSGVSRWAPAPILKTALVS